MAKPLLELETLDPDRPFLTIDKVRYDLALPDDFGLIQSARMARLLRMARETEVEVAKGPADAPVDQALLNRLEAIVDEQLALILYAPAEVRAKLRDAQKLAVIAAFTPAVEERTAPPRPTPAPTPRKPTSGSSSRSSRRRTVRPTGSRCRSGT